MHELFKYVVRGKWREVGEGKCICSCKRSRTTRSSMKMGWYHMVSEASTERFVFRVCSGVWCVRKLHISHEPCVRRHRFSMTTKSPTLNISAFVPNMYHQRSTPSRIHWQLHVKGVVSCPPYTVKPCRKSLRKSFVIHWFERSTVWCWLLVLKMSSSVSAHAP